MSDFVTVTTPDLTLRFWPSCGGRLISLQAGATEFLWRNPDYFDEDGRLAVPQDQWTPIDGTMGSWSNVGGSKTWPAPQGWDGPDQWPGPPDPVLDSGRWELTEHGVDADGTTTVEMTSPPDPRTGLQVTRRFAIPPTGTTFTQHTTFRNASDRPVRWSIWEVCQVDTESSKHGGRIQVAVDAPEPPLVLLDAVGQVDTGQLNGKTWSLPVQDVVAKLGFTTANRLVALRRPDGQSLEIGFTAAEGDYPDGGSRVELWLQYPLDDPLEEFQGLHPQARLVELEVLGPLIELAPGAETSAAIRWTVHRAGDATKRT